MQYMHISWFVWLTEETVERLSIGKTYKWKKFKSVEFYAVLKSAMWLLNLIKNYMLSLKG